MIDVLHLTNLINLLKSHKKDCHSHDCAISIYHGKELAKALIIYYLKIEQGHKEELLRLVDEVGV